MDKICVYNSRTKEFEYVLYSVYLERCGNDEKKKKEIDFIDRTNRLMKAVSEGLALPKALKVARITRSKFKHFLEDLEFNKQFSVAVRKGIQVQRAARNLSEPYTDSMDAQE